MTKSAPSEFDRGQLAKRAADLDGKVAVISAGGATETEINEKKFRVDDAVAATKRRARGRNCGGRRNNPLGLAVNFAKHHKNSDAGAEILVNALKKPFLQLMDNALTKFCGAP